MRWYRFILPSGESNVDYFIYNIQAFIVEKVSKLAVIATYPMKLVIKLFRGDRSSIFKTILNVI